MLQPPRVNHVGCERGEKSGKKVRGAEQGSAGSPVPRALTRLLLGHRGAAGRARGCGVQMHCHCHRGASDFTVQLPRPFSFCQTGNVEAAAPVPVLLAGGEAGGARARHGGTGLSWGAKGCGFPPRRASGYLSGHLPLSLSDTWRLSAGPRSCLWHRLTESLRAALG